MTISDKNAEEIKKFINGYLRVEEEVAQKVGKYEMRELHNFTREDLESVVQQLSSDEGRKSFDANQPISDRGLTLMHLTTVTESNYHTGILLNEGADPDARSYTNPEKESYITPLSSALVNFRKNQYNNPDTELYILEAMMERSGSKQFTLEEKSNLNIYHSVSTIEGNGASQIMKKARSIMHEKDMHDDEMAMATQLAKFPNVDIYYSPIDFFLHHNNREAMKELLSERTPKEKIRIFDSSVQGRLFRDQGLYIEDPRGIFPDADEETANLFKRENRIAAAEDIGEQVKARQEEKRRAKEESEKREQIKQNVEKAIREREEKELEAANKKAKEESDAMAAKLWQEEEEKEQKQKVKDKKANKKSKNKNKSVNKEKQKQSLQEEDNGWQERVSNDKQAQTGDDKNKGFGDNWVQKVASEKYDVPDSFFDGVVGVRKKGSSISEAYLDEEVYDKKGVTRSVYW